VQEPRGRDVGDDHVLARHLLERHLGMLGVGHTVGEVGMRHADGKIPQRVVDVAAGDDELRVAKQQLGDSMVERYRRHQYRPPSLRWSQLTTFFGTVLSTTRLGALASAPGCTGAAFACAPARAAQAASMLDA